MAVTGKPAYIVFDERTPVEIAQAFCSADGKSHMGDWKCSVKWAADLSAAHFWEFRYFTIYFGAWN